MLLVHKNGDDYFHFFFFFCRRISLDIRFKITIYSSADVSPSNSISDHTLYDILSQIKLLNAF